MVAQAYDITEFKTVQIGIPYDLLFSLWFMIYDFGFSAPCESVLYADKPY